MSFTSTRLGVLASAALVAYAGTFVSCSDNESVEERSWVPSAPLLAMSLLENQLSGAIFTTVVDGSRVNANLYASREDVYLDGGPGPQAPVGAAGLPAGDYFFQVTDPSGKDLLSSDHVSCRRVHVNDLGVIDEVYPGTTYVRSGPTWEAVPCQHLQGTDLDHADDGAITVQLYPYDQTPNNGGVYKVWLTPVGAYAGNPAFVPTSPSHKVNGELWQPANVHGFIPSYSKTDNFKVKKPGKPCPAQTLTITKFHDANMNTVKDATEPFIEGWGMAVGDPLGASNQYYTTAHVTASMGLWTVIEALPSGVVETAAYRDGTLMSAYPTASRQVQVEFSATCGETHAIAYGNVAAGSLEVCKLYDRDGDGVADEGEPMVPGWRFTLTGTNVTGGTYGPTQLVTGSDGCVSSGALLPGSYLVTEQVPPGGAWQPTGTLTQTVTIASQLSGSELTGSTPTATFGNRCFGYADFDTKGYWHNKNGLGEITAGDVAFVNGLAPYATPSSYFDAGDEPFNGLFASLAPVAASLGGSAEELAPAGSTLAEISQFLVDSNATGDPREQLAQQLLAFILNVRHRLDDPSAMIQLPDSSIVEASAFIEQAIAAWTSGTDAERTAMAASLDQMNNDDTLPFVFQMPCPVVYP